MKLIRIHQDQRPMDEQGRYHGFWLVYSLTDMVALCVNYIHGKEVGYEEWHTKERSTYYIQ